MPRLVLSQIHVKWFALTSIFKLTTSADWEIIGNQIYHTSHIMYILIGIGIGGLGDWGMGDWGMGDWGIGA